MKTRHQIIKYCSIIPQKVIIDDAVGFEQAAGVEAGEFLKNTFKHYKVKYPKFYKMDKLTKLGFLTAEILLVGTELGSRYKESRIGIVLANASSSIDIDTSFQETIDDKSNYFPSPALFVYTLPNIMAGEICIRHKFKGENIVFISQEPPFELIFDYVNMMFQDDKLDACICGWVEVNGEDYKSFLYLVERKGEEIQTAEGNNEFTLENLIKINNT